jgi:hypothetical protein
MSDVDGGEKKYCNKEVYFKDISECTPHLFSPSTFRCRARARARPLPRAATGPARQPLASRAPATAAHAARSTPRAPNPLKTVGSAYSAPAPGGWRRFVVPFSMWRCDYKGAMPEEVNRIDFGNPTNVTVPFWWAGGRLGRWGGHSVRPRSGSSSDSIQGWRVACPRPLTEPATLPPASPPPPLLCSLADLEIVR